MSTKWPLLGKEWPLFEQKWPFWGILAKNRNFACISCEVREMRTKWPLLGEKWPFFGAKMAISDTFGKNGSETQNKNIVTFVLDNVLRL